MSWRPEAPLHLRFFLSSPGDLPEERNLAQQIIEQNLQKDDFVRSKITCEVVRWDDPSAPAAMPATLTPQEAVNRNLAQPGECEVVIVMLWSRLGTPLPDTHKRPDGTPYLSGTEWEYENAQSAQPQPHILVYRRKSTFAFDPENSEEQVRQYKRVVQFFDRFRNSDGSLRGGFVEYQKPEEFGERLLKDLKAFIKSRLEPKVVGNRSSERRPSRLRSTLESRNLGSGQEKREPLVTVPRARLDKLKELQGRLDAYIGGYVTCRELSELCATIASGLEHAGNPSRHGDTYFWNGLCDDLRRAREKLEGLPELFKQDSTLDIQTFEERLSSADDHVRSARDCDQQAEYGTAVKSSTHVLEQMKREIGSMIVRAKKTTDTLLKEFENIIQRILEWFPPAPEAAQDQARRQTDSYAAKLQRPGEEQKATDLAPAPK